MNTAQPVDPDDDLGPEIVSCRRLSALQSLRAQGVSPVNAWVEHYLITPFGSLMLSAACLYGLSVLFFDDEFLRAVSGTLPVLAIWFSLAAVICWLLYTWHQHDHFVLHENGLRIRIGFKRLHARFESITNVYNTIPESLIEVEYDRLGRYYEPETCFTDLPARMDATSIAVELADGRTRVFRVLTRFESSDVARLLVSMRLRSEGWWPEPEA